MDLQTYKPISDGMLGLIELYLPSKKLKSQKSLKEINDDFVEWSKTYTVSFTAMKCRQCSDLIETEEDLRDYMVSELCRDCMTEDHVRGDL